MTRPPRKPSRPHPLSAAKPILFVLVAALLALSLLTAAVGFATNHASTPAAAPWDIEIANRSGVPIERATLLAVPATRGVYAIAEETISRIANGLGDSVSFTVYRPCDVRVELLVDGRVHVFERVVRVGPGHDSRARVDITPGPLVDGRPPDEVRQP